MYILDVSGHGASAALLSVTLSRWLSAIPGESNLFQSDETSDTGFRISRPAEVAAYLNGRFRSAPGIAQYFTMVYGVLDIDTHEFTYVAAGHPGPIQVSAAGESTHHPSTGKPIGMLSEIEFYERTLALNPGDRLYFYTDGVTEALDSHEEEFGKARLLEILSNDRELPVSETLERVVARVREWQGDELGIDDLSLLATEIG